MGLKVSVVVRPRSREEKVVQTGDGYIVYVHDAPIENRANEAMVRLLARHFGISRAQVRIVAGQKGRRKIVEISTEKGGEG